MLGAREGGTRQTKVSAPQRLIVRSQGDEGKSVDCSVSAKGEGSQSPHELMRCKVCVRAEKQRFCSHAESWVRVAVRCRGATSPASRRRMGWQLWQHALSCQCRTSWSHIARVKSAKGRAWCARTMGRARSASRPPLQTACTTNCNDLICVQTEHKQQEERPRAHWKTEDGRGHAAARKGGEGGLGLKQADLHGLFTACMPHAERTVARGVQRASLLASEEGGAALVQCFFQLLAVFERRLEVWVA
eukprot:838246-Rhodomonas_salina.1